GIADTTAPNRPRQSLPGLQNQLSPSGLPGYDVSSRNPRRARSACLLKSAASAAIPDNECPMPRTIRLLVVVVVLAAGAGFLPSARGDDKAARPAQVCAGAVDNYFEDELWAKVGVQKCLNCHRKGGDAEDSKFLLIDPRKREGAARDEAMRHNRAAF